MLDEEFKELAEKKCKLIELMFCPDRMYSRLPTLYNMKNGKLRQWHVRTDNNIVSVTFGEVDGRQILKWTESVGKNVGKANATTASQQAILDAISKWNKKRDEAYFLTKEEAALHINRKPMQAHNYKDHADKIKYPCILQPKLNGRRIMIDKDLNAQSKSGEVCKVPEHWIPDLMKLKEAGLLEHGLDGEVFAGYVKQGGLSLQRINSAFLKPNADTPRLKFYVYDIPNPSEPNDNRDLQLVNSVYWAVSWDSPIVVVDSELCGSPKEADDLYNEWLGDGAEGCVYRNLAGMYEFGKRSYNLIKRKPRQDAEACVLDVRKDKSQEGVLSCITREGALFECKMRKDAHSEINYRLYENACDLIGEWITYEYEELSDSGVPKQAVGVGIRKCNEEGEPLE